MAAGAVEAIGGALALIVVLGIVYWCCSGGWSRILRRTVDAEVSDAKVSKYMQLHKGTSRARPPRHAGMRETPAKTAAATTLAAVVERLVVAPPRAACAAHAQRQRREHPSRHRSADTAGDTAEDLWERLAERMEADLEVGCFDSDGDDIAEVDDPFTEKAAENVDLVVREDEKGEGLITAYMHFRKSRKQPLTVQTSRPLAQPIPELHRDVYYEVSDARRNGETPQAAG